MAYTYTDLTLKMKIDPKWLADASEVYVGLESANAPTVEVTTTEFDTATGIITATLTQAQTAKLNGVTKVQVNGFLDGARWATEKVAIRVDQNVIRRVIANA